MVDFVLEHIELLFVHLLRFELAVAVHVAGGLLLRDESMAWFAVLHHRQMLLLKSSEVVCRAWAAAHANGLLVFSLGNRREDTRGSLNSPRLCRRESR